MIRLLVFTLIASLGSGSAALAGETLVQSAARIVGEATQATGAATSSSTSSIAASHAATWATRIPAGTNEALLQAQGPVLSNSGMRKRTKVLIYLAAGVGFAATAYAIDHKVLDVTPSSLGTRKD